MAEADREHLRVVISVALATAPKRVKRAWLDRYDEQHQAAGRQLGQAVADAVLQSFDVARKPDRGGPSLHSWLTEG